jgi:transcriptional regulator with XRE-family HTH domain
MAESGRTRLGQAMEQRRIALRMAWQDVAKAANLSVAGLGAIRRGERSPMPLTRRKLEDALRWQAGSIEAIQAGGDPTPISSGGEPSPGDELTRLRAENAELHAQVEEVEELRRELQELRAEIDRLRKVRKSVAGSG